MVNQNKTKIPRNQADIGPWIIFLVVMAIGVAAMVSASIGANPAQQCSITGSEYDNLMSEDMAAFIAQNPGEYEESDMN
jgi:hypothetical protein